MERDAKGGKAETEEERAQREDHRRTGGNEGKEGKGGQGRKGSNGRKRKDGREERRGNNN